MASLISIKKLNKKFEDLAVFDNLSLDVEKGKILAIFGPNGCGKSTLLNILAGISDKNGGEYKIDGRKLSNFSYIFQNYRDSLFPWMDNYKNLAFPLKLKGKSSTEIRKKIKSLIELSELNINLKKYPYQLSGGQQQILAFLRALITNPEVLFIDEPFSALDYENNLLLRNFLQKYYSLFRPTIVIITHDIEEAAHLANKIIVLSKNPTRVVRTIDNNSSYPRGIDFLTTQKFKEIKDSILMAFKEGAKL